MTQINIGDKVIVVDTGKSYSTYQTWANVHGLQNYANKDHIYLNKGSIATVVAKGDHLADNVVLLGLRTDQGVDYIIDERGVEMVTPSQKSLLTNGRRVKLRNGNMFVVLDSTLVALDKFDNYRGLKWSSDNIQKSYDVNLMNVRSSEYDVLAIYEKPSCVIDYFFFSKHTNLIWQREEKTAKQLQLEALQKQAQDVADAIKKLQDEE